MIWAGVLLLALALLGTPLFVVFGALAWLLFWAAGINPAALMIEFYRLASAPSLLTIPLFTFAGAILAASQAPQRLVRCAQAVVGWLPGGLALVALSACAFFTAFTGASGVTIIALGGLLLPLLLQERYPERFSIGLLTTCGSLGLLFPPSLPVILYGLVAQTPVDLLFLAGLAPGWLLVVSLALFSLYQARRHHVPVQRSSWAEARQTLWQARWELALPLLVLGGLYGGLVTINEAAVLTAGYSLLVTVVIHHDLHLWRDVPQVMTHSMVLVGSIFLILGMALGLTSYCIDAQVPMHILETIRQYITSRAMFLLALNLLLLVIGCMMDIFSAIVVIVPLITPIAAQFGVHPLHLGIIVLTNLEIGYSTPPVGLNLFLGSLRFERSMTALCRASWPFVCLLLGVLGLITYLPDLSLGLVRFLGYAELPSLRR
ncbi:MAG: TRAP transporter large permease [Candidatus Tectomicrobia bacterium]|uniref:TRAP transporter large permease n=1 Tax=Tectimicrobiota bacterium TaxID=2528274 RepID=A0A938B5D3_UNCTE|nr:TRAP transporter large permease [Candidatus Tectomicrobia bacterium]